MTRVSLEVGTEGILGGQADVPGVEGMWKVLTDNVNLMALNLTTQVRSIAEVTTAVARGDLTKKIDVDVKGEILALKDTVNSMTSSLNVFAAEVTRVAKEVGTDGILGGQASVDNVGGTWKDLTDNVNTMASNVCGHFSGLFFNTNIPCSSRNKCALLHFRRRPSRLVTLQGGSRVWKSPEKCSTSSILSIP